MAYLEHVNVTVSDPDASAALFARLFDWHVRWSGSSKLGGRSVHVGSDDHYVALYSKGDRTRAASSYDTVGGLNHLAIVVEDLDQIETRVKAEGLTPHNHGDYEPGRRFYFHTGDMIEVEVVQYD